MTNSVVVFVTRKGNPKNIRTWEDLVKPGTEVITPNPFTSGGAKWNIMAAYQAQIVAGRTPQQALAYVRRLLANVPVQDKSAREALQTFTGGKGDVMLAYENEAITAQRKGEELDYVVPDATILIENPVAVVKGSANAQKAQAFVDYLHTPAAQRVYAAQGYRSVDPSLVDAKRYPRPAQLFTIRRHRRVAEGQRPVLRSAEGVDRRDPAFAGGLHCRLADQRRRLPTRPPLGRPRSSGFAPLPGPP